MNTKHYNADPAERVGGRITIRHPYVGDRVTSDEIRRAAEELADAGQTLHGVASPNGFTPGAEKFAKESGITLTEE